MTDFPQGDPTVVTTGVPRAPWAAPEPARREPGAPRKGAAAVGHFLLWSVLAVAAVLAVSIAIQVVISIIGIIVILVRDGLDSDADMASGDLLTAMIASQLVSIAVFVPWWKRVRLRGLGAAHPVASAQNQGSERAANLVLTVLGVALMGIGLQLLISLMLGLILPLFPELLREYGELMEAGGTDEFSLPSVLSVAVLAPISEELTMRGVALQFALRGVCLAWDKRLASEAYAKISIGPVRFWAANVIQALAFGILHLNITQGIYAFVIGMVLGWMFGRTGRLRYGIALHLAINFSSYFVGEFYGVFGILGDWGVIVAPVVCLLVGLRLFARAVPVDSDAALAHMERARGRRTGAAI